MTDYDAIEIVQSPTQSLDLVSNVWKRFKRHRGAIAGSIVVGVIVAMCLFAFLSPYDPDKSSILNRFQPPVHLFTLT
jgi:ABC-type antimicrobial peptide transport system permease subunit